MAQKPSPRRKLEAVPPTYDPSGSDAIKAAREVTRPGPSGIVYTLRPINLERHALAGGLPARLRQIALAGSDAIDKLLLGEDEVEVAEDDEPISPDAKAAQNDARADVLMYLDGLVRTLLVSVEWNDVDVEDIPPVDYKWAVKIAMGEGDEDGEGRRLWGREPLSRFNYFRHFHGCDEDCEGCNGVREFFSATVLGTGSVS